MPAALNLSNEVVKMRAEVKRVKVLIIRKLTRQIVSLKKKKGTEAALEKNQRRAARLLEEIHELKALAPDSVTKAALQSDISFEKVCQKKESSLAERATARIATHPEFSKRIQSIKNAIEAFKAERKSVEKKGKNSTDTEQQETESELDSDHEEGSEEEEDDSDNADDDDDNTDNGSCIKIQKADEEQLKYPTMQNKDPVTAKESCSEVGSTTAEVVRMRKEVKKLRVLIIRNLTQQIVVLKKAKSDDSELKGNMECAARLQKEVHILRRLLPDHVTIRALEGDIDMEKVFQDPESSALERATARIVTHERFLKKLQDVRQAIEKEKAKKDGGENKDVNEMKKAGDSDGETENEDKEEEVAGDDTDDDDDDDDDDDGKDAEEEEEEEKKEIKVQEKNPSLNIIPSSKFGKLPEDTRLASSKKNPNSVEMEKAACSPANPKSKISKPAVIVVQCLPSKSKETVPPPLKHVSKPDTKKQDTRNDQEESDLSDSEEEEEEEYFDDSTEERFHKQSSYSEQSDDDDFFLGKVSKLKKKKSDAAPRPEKTNDPNKSREKEVKETQEFKMQSVFCSALSKSSTSSQKGKLGGPKASPFQNQKRDEKPPWVKSQGAARERKPPGFKSQTPGSRGGAKPAFDRKNTPIHRAGKHSQQALHPSWEASRKRKEQQAQITAFQGKKIKFDDDDD